MTYENVLAMRIALETGLRIDDVLSLRYEQINGRTLRGIAEKTGKEFRKVISRDLANRLIQGNNGKTGFVFPHRTKPAEHRTRQAVWANMKKAADIMGVNLNAAPHSARKTYAVEVFKDKGLKEAQKELQHDRLSTTMIYAFSNLLTDNEEKKENLSFPVEKIEELANIIADKVVERLEKIKNPC
jgi:integrase